MSHVSARIALAGEYLAASYLMRFCDSVIIAPEGHKADLILDHQGQLYKIQVKTTNSIYKKKDKVENSIAKTRSSLNEINSEESLINSLLEINKIPNLEPIDATTESSI